jgi:hypothetical protein
MNRLAPIACLLLLAGCSAFESHPNTPSQFAVFFTSDSAALTPKGHEVIDGIAAQVKQQTPSRVEIYGQTDGTQKKDLDIADQRAEAVAAALQQSGVPATLIDRHPSVMPGTGVTPVMSRKVLVVLDQ